MAVHNTPTRRARRIRDFENKKWGISPEHRPYYKRKRRNKKSKKKS